MGQTKGGRGTGHILGRGKGLSKVINVRVLCQIVTTVADILLNTVVTNNVKIISTIISTPFGLFNLTKVVVTCILVAPVTALINTVTNKTITKPFRITQCQCCLSLQGGKVQPGIAYVFSTFSFFVRFTLIAKIQVLAVV